MVEQCFGGFFVVFVVVLAVVALRHHNKREEKRRLTVRLIVRGDARLGCYSRCADEVLATEKHLPKTETLLWVLCERLPDVREIVAREHRGQISCDEARLELLRMRVEMEKTLMLSGDDADELETLLLVARDELLELMDERVRKEARERAELARRAGAS